MQNKIHDGSIDMNAFAAILALAPKGAGDAEQAFSALGRLDADWVEKRKDAAPANDWDPWSAEPAVTKIDMKSETSSCCSGEPWIS